MVNESAAWGPTQIAERRKADGVMPPNECLHSVGVKCPANFPHTRNTIIDRRIFTFIQTRQAGRKRRQRAEIHYKRHWLMVRLLPGRNGEAVSGASCRSAEKNGVAIAAPSK